MNIIRFSDFDPVKYSSTRVVVAIMEWLRYYTINDREVTVTSPVDKFLSETRLDRAQFLTFVSEMDKHGKEYGFSVEVDGDTVTFSELKNTGKKMIFESNGEKIILYHGSNTPNISKLIAKSNNYNNIPKCIFLSSSKKVARNYGKYIYKCEVMLDNVTEYDAHGMSFHNFYSFEDLINDAHDEDYNGCIFRDIMDSKEPGTTVELSDVYVMFNSDDVKVLKIIK